jgi:hypothetical protein
MPNHLRFQELVYHAKLDHGYNFARSEVKKGGSWTTAGTFPTLMAILISFGTRYVSQTRLKFGHTSFQLVTSFRDLASFKATIRMVTFHMLEDFFWRSFSLPPLPLEALVSDFL